MIIFKEGNYYISKEDYYKLGLQFTKGVSYYCPENNCLIDDSKLRRYFSKEKFGERFVESNITDMQNTKVNTSNFDQHSISNILKNSINKSTTEISKDLYNKFNELGLIPNDIRNDNVGTSDYSQHIIQPWSIWKDYNLNPWDADIIKRVLRNKEIDGKTIIESRVEDYQKIIHICQERIRQLSC